MTFRSSARRAAAFFALSLGFAPMFAGPGFSAEETSVRMVDILPAEGKNPHYVENRAPLLPAPLMKLPIGSIVPRGWLREQLELEANGMTGHLPEISAWCKFEGNAWASPTGVGHSGWEELPYWLKGYGDLGYVLGNEEIIQHTRKWVEAVMTSQTGDGYFGPRANRTSLKGTPDLWPHMVMCNVLQSYYEFARDPRALACLLQYYRWLSSLPGAVFGAGYWPRLRAGDAIETAYWLYNRTGEGWLLELAGRIHENMGRWDTGAINHHNVNIAQGFREPGVYYQQAGRPRLLAQAERNYREIMDVWGQVPGGGFGGDENCRPGFIDPRQGFETCGIVEFMHSFEMLTKISGNPLWADRCEEIAFNSFPAALTPDGKALHYLTSPNQAQLDRQNKAPGIDNQGNMFAYSPDKVFRCCQHNVAHGWPYYAEELWLATADRGLCASLYAAGEVTAKVGAGDTVKITEQTDYPFSDTIEFKIHLARPAHFPLYLRLPRWCADATIKLNGKRLRLNPRPLAYAVLERTWRDGDRVTLRLPMRLSVRTWEKNQNSVSVDYGPLTFALQIGERWVRYGGTEAWPEHEVYPTSPWNYGLVLHAKNPAKSFKLLRRSGKLPSQPFTPETVPIFVKAKARSISAWRLDAQGLVMPLQPSPVKSDAPLEAVTLIPMGAARLRISAFPVIGAGPAAHEWSSGGAEAGAGFNPAPVPPPAASSAPGSPP